MAFVFLKNIFAKQKASLIIPALICVFSVAALILFYVCDTTEVINVWLNSHNDTPLIYKICGIWGNHEGSMLLFFTFLTTWSALLLRTNNEITIASFFLLSLGIYLYFQANPFVILNIKASVGQDLNPALQNLYLTIHPPILYLGQSLCFVIWIWSIFSKNHPKVQFYTKLCLGFITCGLILGARWAYSELGWGGFWYWDPVETVSLFPWLTIVAAVHGQESNRTALLLSFPMVILSLCLVRSGILVSIHSFGFDLQNGIWLGLYACLVWLATIIFFLKSAPQKAPILTAGFLIFLALLIALIFLPIICTYVFHTHFIIDEAFFHRYINPLVIVLLFFAGLAPHMKFQQHTWSIISVILATILWCWKIQPFYHHLATFAALIGFWLIFSSLKHLKIFFQKGFVSAHLGIGLCILSASHGEIFTEKFEINVNDMPVQLGNYKITYQSQNIENTLQVSQETVRFIINSSIISPSRLFFRTNKITKHQPDWTQINLDHLHATVYTDHNVWQVELMLKPMIAIFWFGLLLVILGIYISIFKSRKIPEHFKSGKVAYLLYLGPVFIF